MFFKLDKARYPEIKKQTASIEFPLIQAVIHQKQAGEIYTDHAAAPQQLFIIHKSGFSYYQTQHPETTRDFIDFIQATKALPSYFHLYDPPAFLLDPTLYGKRYNQKIRKRIQLRIGEAAIQLKDNTLPYGLKIGQIDALNYDSLEEAGFMGNKFYESKDDFLQNGLGVCIFDQNGQALSLCYSACIVNNRAEIDIVTKPDQRGLGYGKMVTAAFIQLALKKEIIPNWDCFEDNTASLKTALKAGFFINKEYKFLSLYTREE